MKTQPGMREYERERESESKIRDNVQGKAGTRYTRQEKRIDGKLVNTLEGSRGRQNRDPNPMGEHVIINHRTRKNRTLWLRWEEIPIAMNGLFPCRPLLPDLGQNAQKNGMRFRRRERWDDIFHFNEHPRIVQSSRARDCAF